MSTTETTTDTDIPKEYLSDWVWYLTIRKGSLYGHQEAMRKLPYHGFQRIPADIANRFERRFFDLIMDACQK